MTNSTELPRNLNEQHSDTLGVLQMVESQKSFYAALMIKYGLDHSSGSDGTRGDQLNRFIISFFTDRNFQNARMIQVCFPSGWQDMVLSNALLYSRCLRKLPAISRHVWLPDALCLYVELLLGASPQLPHLSLANGRLFHVPVSRESDRQRLDDAGQRHESWSSPCSNKRCHHYHLQPICQ